MDLLLVALVAAALGAALGTLAARSRTAGALAVLGAERDGLRAERDAAVRAREAAGVELAAALGRAGAAEARLEAERLAAAQRVADLEHSQARLKESFEALSRQALEANGRQFLEMARDTLKAATTEAKGDLDQRRQQIEHMVGPVRETLGKVQVQLQAIEVAREGAYRGLVAQVDEIRQTSADLRRETAALVTALRKPQVRGRWGEMHLRNAVELAGMTQHCDFAEQVTTDTGDVRMRPDLVVRLTGGKRIVVDAKVPLAAFLEAAESADEAVREARLKDHARQLRTHIDGLADKSYKEIVGTPEFVVLFVPGDAFLAAALDVDPGLYEHAARRDVLVTTPTTLIALLRTVALTWRQEALAESAKQVCDLGRELYKRLSTMGGHVATLGRALNSTVSAYNKTVGSLESQVLPQARRFRDLQVTTDAELAELPPVESDVRSLRTTELIESAATARPVVALPSHSDETAARGFLVVEGDADESTDPPLAATSG